LQAIIGDDPLDTALADLELRLAQFLGDDCGRGLGVQKAVAQDLPHGLVGAAVIGFGPGLLRLEREQAAGLEGLQELIITLAAVAVFLGEGGDVLLFLQTLAFDEQEEPVSQGVGGGDGQDTGGASQLVGIGIELEGRMHGESLQGMRVNV
jgi:hypothetical protein